MKVAFLNHKQNHCGVYQYGKRLANILLKSTDINFVYFEIADLNEYNNVCHDAQMIMYNYHPLTMQWLNNSTICKSVINICIYHEGTVTANFDYYINIDPWAPVNDISCTIPRPLFESVETTTVDNGDTTVIGSFGFGSNYKGFDKLVNLVNDQFDKAIIKINMPTSYYGDHDAQICKELENICKSQQLKPGIELTITDTFMTDDELLKFLAGNTINIFMYDHQPGRGCASVIDYALSVDRPIGISDSHMFRHIYDDSIMVYKRKIVDIIADGDLHMQKYKQLWKNETLINTVEQFLHKIEGIEVISNMVNNTVINDKYRKFLAPTINQLFSLVPDMMSRKIPRANVQQAFVFKYILDNFTKDDKLICVGSHEDTCCAGLKVLGFNVLEIDPAHNSDLHTHCINTNYELFDVVFSVSVIEHVPNDDEFIDDMCKSLKSGGTCIFTCDFNDEYVPGNPLPWSDHRFYTKNDMLVRINNILIQNDCYLYGEINYDAPPDFIYEGIRYSFASMVFKKK